MSAPGALNYTPEAIQELTALARLFDRRSLHADARNLRWLVDQLHHATKFRGPDYGMLFDLDIDRSPLAERARLPARSVVVEFASPPRTYHRAKVEEHDAHKRIAFASSDLGAFDRLVDGPLSPGDSETLKRMREREGFFAIPIWYDAQDAMWVPCYTMVLVAPIPAAERERAAHGWKSDVAQNPFFLDLFVSRQANLDSVNNRLFDEATVPFLPTIDAATRKVRGPQRYHASAWLDTHDETLTAIDLSLAHARGDYLDDTLAIPVPVALNAKRAQLGQPPLYGYEVISPTLIREVNTKGSIV